LDGNGARTAPGPGVVARLSGRWAALRARIGAIPTTVKSAGWSISGYAAGAAASFGAQVILARALDATRYGVYSYLLGWVNVAVLVGKLEFDTAAIRFVAAYAGQREDGLLRGFLQCGWRMVSRTATGVALGAGVLAWLFLRHVHAGIEGGSWMACLLVPLTASLAFSSGALQGFRRVPQAQLPQMLLRPVLFGIGIVVAGSGLGVDLGAGEAVALNAAATAAALGVSLRLLRRAVPASSPGAAPAFDTARWLRTVTSFMLISAAQLVLSQQADILVVGTLLGPRDAGLYSAASQLANLIGLSAAAVIFVVFPIVADLHARGQRTELQRLVVRTVQGCAAVSVPVTLLLFTQGDVVLHLYGSAFVEAYPVLLVLSTAQFLGVTVGVPGSFLPITGHEWPATRVIVGTAVLNLALTALLTPTFGVLGAATATLVAQLTKVGVLRWYAWRYLGVTALWWLPAGQRRREDV